MSDGGQGSSKPRVMLVDKDGNLLELSSGGMSVDISKLGNTKEVLDSILRELKILNGRFEEAFQTKLSDEDLS